MTVDRMIAVLAVLLAGAYFYATRQITVLSFGDPIGPRLFPYLITGAILIGAVVLAMETVAARKAAKPIVDAPAAANNGPHIGWMVVGVIGWTLLYIVTLETLGYVISTIIFMLGLTFYFHRKRHVVNVATSVLVPLATYIVFNYLLSVNLPAGLLAF